MVIRVIAVPDSLELPNFDEVFRTVLGWDGLGFIFRECGSNPGVKPLSAQSPLLRLRAKSRVPAPEHFVQFAIENFCAGLQ